MLIEFRQGIYRQSDSQPFLAFTGKSVDIRVSGSPTIITLSHGKSNYLFTEDASISPAWLGPFPQTHTTWLYWDIDLITGKRTFGKTTVDPFANKGYGSTLPLTPIKGQHYFLTSENKMKYFNGRNWKTVIRVFAGSVKRNATLTVFQNGTQVARNVITTAGHIMFDDNNIPIKKAGLFNSSEFVTTETIFKPQSDINNKYKVSTTQINAKASEPIPKFHCVSLKNSNQYGLASSSTPEMPCIGVAVEDITRGRIGKIATHGIIENKDFWNFTDARGTPVWVGHTGEVLSKVPQRESMQNIGYVIDPSTIFLNIQHPTTLITARGDCFAMSATPTNTPTPTVTPTNTVTPTLTPTITPTITVTQSVTPTIPVTPTMTPTNSIIPTIGATPTPSPAPILFGGMMAWWALDESSSIEMNSVPNGAQLSLPVNIPGMFGGGINSVLSVPLVNASAFDFGDMDFTFSVWVKIYMEDEIFLFGDSHNIAYGLSYHPDQGLQFSAVRLDGGLTSVNLGALDTGDWYHIVIYYNSRLEKFGIILNNGSIITVDHPGGLSPLSGDLIVGTLNQIGSVYEIIDVGCWDRVLTQFEISELYNDRAGISYPGF